MKEVFKWKDYINTYPDLKLIKNEDEALNHWVKFGKKENRILIFDTICLFHCGDMKVFEELINLFPLISRMRLIISYYNDEYKLKLENFNPELNILKLIKVKNRGMDIGGFLMSINFLFNNSHLYNSETRFLKLHTKSISKNKEWTLNAVNSILKYKLSEFSVPAIFGCDKYIYDFKNCNTIYLNYKYMKEIFKRGEDDKIEKFDKYYDIYYEDFISNNEYKDLFPSEEFYKNYHSDLKHENCSSMKHWYKHGCEEHFRRSNVNYIKSWAKYINKFVAGTMFGFNKKWLDIFKRYNLNHEFNILEKKYTNNKYATKVHSWEYYFGFITLFKRGKIISCKESKLKNIYCRELTEQRPKYSLINNNFSKSKIAIFLPSLDIDRTKYNFKEIINLINFLNNRNYILDIYLGKFNDSFDKYDKNLFFSPTPYPELVVG